MRDAEIRPLLKSYLTEMFAGEELAFVEEQQVYTSRIDLVALTATLHGFEIKGPKDTLGRLDFQLEAFLPNLPSITFLADTKHFAELSKRVPEFCGLLELCDSATAPRIELRRLAGRNPKWDAAEMLRMIGPEEIVNWLERRGQARGFRGKRSFRILVPAVLERVPEAEVPLIVARHLRLREPSRAKQRLRAKEWHQDWAA